MSFAKKLGIVTGMLLGLVAGAWAQRRGGMGVQAPQMPMTWFKPVAGSGAQYDVTTLGKASSFSFVVLGKENVEGKDGYWIEIRAEGGSMPGETVMKALTVVDEGKGEVKRMIMQMAGAPPMEMPAGMLAMTKQQQPQAGSSDPGEKVGSESVTVPAGTFECDHYRKNLQGKTIDSWVSTKVAPYGLVKMTSAEMTLELRKTLSNETSHIKGEPGQMRFPH
jgi:hypothetical protein